MPEPGIVLMAAIASGFVGAATGSVAWCLAAFFTLMFYRLVHESSKE